MSKPDPLLESLRALRAIEGVAAAAEQTRQRSRKAFLAAGTRTTPSWLNQLGRLYFTAEPAIATALALVYLAWTSQTALALGG